MHDTVTVYGVRRLVFGEEHLFSLAYTVYLALCSTPLHLSLQTVRVYICRNHHINLMQQSEWTDESAVEQKGNKEAFRPHWHYCSSSKHYSTSWYLFSAFVLWNEVFTEFVFIECTPLKPLIAERKWLKAPLCTTCNWSLQTHHTDFYRSLGWGVFCDLKLLLMPPGLKAGIYRSPKRKWIT